MTPGLPLLPCPALTGRTDRPKTSAKALAILITVMFFICFFSFYLARMSAGLPETLSRRFEPVEAGWGSGGYRLAEV
jgi:hypothetical protein